MEAFRKNIVPYIRSMWLRRWQAMLTAWMFCLIGWATVITLPDIYEAKTRIYVDTTSLVRPLMRGIAVDTNVNDIVDEMQRTLLSRPNLIKVVHMADLDIGTKANIESLVLDLQERVSFTSQGPNLFVITYRGPDRATATKVVRSLLNVFVDSNLGNSRQDMQVARDFVDQQLAAYTKQLDEADKRMADFRAKNAGFLPGDENYTTKFNLAKQQLQSAQADLDDAVQQRDELKTQVASLPPYLEGVGDAAAGPPLGASIGASASFPSRVGPDPAVRAAELEQKLDELLEVDTPQNPDVVQLRHQLDAAKKAAEAARKDEATEQKINAPVPSVPAEPLTRVANPVHDQLMIQLVTLEGTIAGLKAKADRAQAEVQKWQSLAATAPDVQTEMAKMTRDYDIVKQTYDQLLARRDSAKIGNDLDTETQAVQYRIIDPPDAPPMPVAPNRPLMLSAVFVVALGVGIGFAFLLANLDDAVQTVGDLVQRFGLPVVGSVTMIWLPGQQRRMRRQMFLFGATAFVLFVAYGGVMSAVLLLQRAS